MMTGFVHRLFSRRRARPQARLLHDGAAPRDAASLGPVDARLHLVGAQAGRARQLKGRIWLSLSVFVMVFAVLGARLAQVSLIGEGERPVLAAASEPEGPRPVITDRNGVPLAMNRSVTGLAVDTRNVWDARETASGLAGVFADLDVDRLVERIEARRWVVIRNELTAGQERAVLALGLPGVVFTEGARRVYPQGTLGAHAAGYTIAGKGGVAGLEYLADTARAPVTAALDMRAQQILEEELARTMEEFSVPSAWGVIMAAKTGEVIALASLPSFNPNDVDASPASHWRNRAMQDRYELGSAFKVLTAASVLEEGLASPATLYDARRPLRIHDRTIDDFHPRREIMTLSQVIQYSSNIGIGKAALELGAGRQKAYFEKLGLTRALDTELLEKREPDLPRRWGPVETVTASYGQGIAVTPLQLTAAVAAVVNGGTWRAPSFVRAEGPRDGSPVFSARTSAQMRLIMRQVITDGTSSKAEAPGYYPIGKTATADKPGPGGYRKDARLSSFVGAFPGYDPEYVILVSFDEPQGTDQSWGYATAGWVAAPAFSRVVSRLGPAMGIAPVQDDHAFAQFMSGLRSSDEIALAMNAVEAQPVEPAAPMDDVARLLAEELGP